MARHELDCSTFTLRRGCHRTRAASQNPLRGQIISSNGNKIAIVSSNSMFHSLRRNRMIHRKPVCFLGCLFITAGFLLSWQPAVESGEGTKSPSPQEVQKVVDKAVDFFKISQGKDGSFSPKIAGPGITAVAIAAMVRNGVSPQEPVVAKGLEYLVSQSKEDGGIYSQFLANYTTSVALMAFKESNKNGKYDQVIKKAAEFIKKIQHDEEESHLDHGGLGYDKKSRPDLSNTAYSVEALLAAGLSKDDPAVQRALKFISRCQNLPGEKNDQAFAKKATKDDKGGFTYDPHVTDKNKQKTPEGGLRSLGAMTYNGLKSFLYAGVTRSEEHTSELQSRGLISYA